jgi:hypothetical protein
MTGTLVLLGLLALVAAAILRSYRRLKRLHGAAQAAYNAEAFKEVVEAGPDARYDLVTRLASELERKKGVKAIAVRTSSYGVAIHHINQNGSFSAKGPYFVSRYSHNWRRTGATHLVKVLRGKGRWGFAPDHYNQTGVILEKGAAIVEYNTQQHGQLDIWDFAERFGKAQQGAPADGPRASRSARG